MYIISVEQCELMISRTVARIIENFVNKQNKKLTRWCCTEMNTKENQNRLLNLSNTKISYEIQQILNLGLNCHIKTKTQTIQSKIEMEKLVQQLESKKRSNAIIIPDYDKL